jgi:hypothetical protein
MLNPPSAHHAFAAVCFRSPDEGFSNGIGIGFGRFFDLSNEPIEIVFIESDCLPARSCTDFERFSGQATGSVEIHATRNLASIFASKAIWTGARLAADL